MTEGEFYWLSEVSIGTKGPVLEIGSRRVPTQGGGRDIRRLWPDVPYTGIDQIDGPGVDIVTEWPCPCAKERRKYYGKYETVLCLSVLEHTLDPWVVARGCAEALKPGGTLIVSAPFCHAYHPHPEDYWRFTPDGLAALFGKNIEWDTVSVIGTVDRVGIYKWQNRQKANSLLRNRRVVQLVKHGIHIDLPAIERRSVGLVGHRP